eukprot:CAMPEP_0201560468 /NCGR_PEP_ID=MMETSP0173_2-20130828/78287_1 /ASSEMBLY_ACC=CAM_ASM_000268 /TAXON_ID=218659 /ORGANISM="Vexillifera sp., Strain DIVA3 564/2" /LENGTH=357 /DNA_ID=CAMNT_0047974921 /DNA_START=69 /DNA_END=1143 /DNA_ORIENTATION=+
MGQSNSSNSIPDWEEGLPTASRERLAKDRERRRRRRMAITPKQMGCCESCCKETIACLSTIVYGINLLFLIFGILLVAAGAYAFVELGEITEFVNIPLSIALIALGGCVVILSFVGCLGAYCQMRTLLKFYLFFLLLVVLAQIGVGVAVYFKKDSVVHEMDKTWNKADDELRSYVQHKFDCCGWETIYDDPVVSDHCAPPPPSFNATDTTGIMFELLVEIQQQQQQLFLQQQQQLFLQQQQQLFLQQQQVDNTTTTTTTLPSTTTTTLPSTTTPPSTTPPSTTPLPSTTPDITHGACKSTVVDFVTDQLTILELTGFIVGGVQFVALLFTFCLIFLIKPDRNDPMDEYERVAMLDDF